MRLSRVLHNTTALFLLDLISKLLPLITFPLVVRALGPETYGKLAFALAVTGFFSLLATVGFPTYGMREIARNPGNPGELVARIQGARLAFSVFAFAVLVAFTYTLAPPDATSRHLLLIAGIPLVISSVDLQWLFYGSSRMWLVTWTAIAGQLLYAGVIVAAVRQPKDAWIIPAASAASSLVIGAMLLALALRRFDLQWPRPRPSEWLPMLPICATLALASVMSMVYDQIDSIMLRYMRGEAELGFYAANYKIMTVCLAFMPILGRVFFPLLSQAAVEDREQEVKYLRWMATGTVGLAIPITVGGLLLAGPVSLFLLGRQFAGSEQLLRWLMPNVIAGALAIYYCGRLVPRNREGKYLMAVIGGAVVNVALNLIFIPRFGAIAAAASTVVSQLAVAVLGRYFERDLPRPMLRAPVGASLLASVVMVAGVLALRKFQLHVLILVLAGAILYAAAYWAIWVAALSRAVKRA